VDDDDRSPNGFNALFQINAYSSLLNIMNKLGRVFVILKESKQLTLNMSSRFFQNDKRIIH